MSRFATKDNCYQAETQETRQLFFFTLTKILVQRTSTAIAIVLWNATLEEDFRPSNNFSSWWWTEM